MTIVPKFNSGMRFTVALMLSLSPLLFINTQAALAAGVLTRISLRNDGSQITDHTQGVSLSSDARYATFYSYGNVLTPSATGVSNPIVYVRDNYTGTTTLVSKKMNGGLADGYNFSSSITPDGRYISYSGTSGNIVSGDTNVVGDVFLYDRLTDTTTRESVGTALVQGNNASNTCSNQNISADARYVVFCSSASNLVPGDNNSSNGGTDVFYRDRVNNTVVRVNVTNTGAESGGAGSAVVSSDGRYVAFVTSSALIPSDTNTRGDVYLKDMQTGVLSVINTVPNGSISNSSASNPSLSGDGRKIKFQSMANDLVSGVATTNIDHIYLRNLDTGTTTLVTKNASGVPANCATAGGSGSTVSGDGRYVGFTSCAGNLVSGDNTTSPRDNIFIWDGTTGVIKRVNPTVNGTPTNFASEGPALSSDGSVVAFASFATNLVPDDTNFRYDLFTYRESNLIPPVVTGVPDRAPGSFGWYSADVTINWDSTDPAPTFGIPSDPQDTIASTEGGSVSYTSGQSCDADGNCATGVLVLSIDKTAPVITVAISQAANVDGWNNTDVTITFSCSDALSGMDSCTAPITLSSEGSTQVVTGTAIDKAGNSSTTQVTVNIDKTNPTITTNIAPLLNQYGWSNTDITIGYSCNDLLSLISFCSSTQTFSTEGAGQAAQGTAIDGAGNSSQVSTTFGIDKTAPVITYDRSPLSNTDGWNNTDVSVTFNCVDSLSGVLTCSDPFTLSQEGAGQVFAGTASDKAGNVSGTDLIINLDKTRPAILANVTPTINANGWSNTDVVVAHDCTDNLSGIKSCTQPQTLTSEGPGQIVMGQAIDRADNMIDVATAISVDKTNPTITASLSSSPTAGGWNGGDVTVTFNCVDALSGVQTCTTPVTLTNEGNGQVVTGTATDKAGNTVSVMAVVNIDKTKPTIAAVISPAPNSDGWNKVNSTVTFTCSDSLSGIDSCTAPTTLTSEGSNQSVTGIAIDKAGNTNSVTSVVSIDKTAPVVNSVTLSSTFLLLFQPITIAASVSDNLSGISTPQGGEYFIDTDPGIGSATPMNYSNGNLTGTINTNPGSLQSHTVFVRTKDKAGNWSTTRSASFTVIL